MSMAILFPPQVLSAIYTFFSLYKTMITTAIMVNIDRGTYTSQGCYRHLIHAFQQFCIVGTVMIPVYKWRNWSLENGRDFPRVSQQQAARPAWIQASLTTKPTFLNTRHLYLRLNKHNRRRGPGGLSDYLPEILRTSPTQVLSLSCLFLRLTYPRVLASFWDALSGAHGDESWLEPPGSAALWEEWVGDCSDTSSQIEPQAYKWGESEVHSISKCLLNTCYVPRSVPQTQTRGSEQDKPGLCSHETYARQKINKKQNDSVR